MNWRFFSYYFLQVFILWSCANQTQPTGGPKDEDPPILISSNPVKGQLNFHQQTLELEFNEMIKADNLQSELIITPSVSSKFKSRINRNRLVITFEEPFKDSTTYTLNFRTSVKDVTESNPAENLYLVFSTGAYLDSLGISGNVKTLLTNEPAANYTVALYDAEDTLHLFNANPLYAVQSNDKGDFQFLNIRAHSYKIYGWKDKNNDLKCQSENEPYAFHPQTLQLDSTISGIELKPQFLNIKPLAIAGARQVGKYYEVRFTKKALSYSLRSLTTPDTIYHHFIEDSKAIRIYDTGPQGFPHNLYLMAVDSAGFQVNDTLAFSFEPTQRPPEPFQISITAATLKSPSSELSVTIEYTKPLGRFADSLWTLTYDTLRIPLLLFNPAEQREVNRMTIVATLPDSLSLKKNLSILFPSVSFQSIESDTSLMMTKPIGLLHPDNFGIIQLSFPEISIDFQVQLLNSKGILQKTFPGSPKINMEYLNADGYKIRVLLDQDSDGQWSPGNFFRNQTPEPVIFFYDPEAKTDIITVKKNWVLGPFFLSLDVDN